MAEERFDSQPPPITPLSERDVANVEPLTTRQILKIAQRYVQASFNSGSLERKIENSPGDLEADTLDTYHYETGYRQGLKEALEELGQDSLISKADERIKQIFDQT